MPSHLHPRSRATSTLFAGTLLASFVVVAVPHIWPCPRPRQAYMDGDIVYDENGRAMRVVRRKNKKFPNTEDKVACIEVNEGQMLSGSGKKSIAEEAQLLESLRAEQAALDEATKRRECPVPKPGGVVGRWLGFRDGDVVTKDTP